MAKKKAAKKATKPKKKAAKKNTTKSKKVDKPQVEKAQASPKSAFGWIILAAVILALLSLSLKPIVVQENSSSIALENTAILGDDIPMGNTVSLRGVQIGASLDDAIEALGKPDFQNAFEEGRIVNIEYGASIGYEKSVLILNFEDGELNRFTITSPGQETLLADDFGQSKRWLYDHFGIPAKQSPIGKFYWLYEFPEKGIDVILYEKEIYGLSFYTPQAIAE